MNYDCDQDDIIKRLENNVQPTGQPAFLENFTEKSVIVNFWRKGLKNWVFYVAKSKGTSSLKLNFFEEPGLGSELAWPRLDPSLVLCNIQEEALHSLVWNELILNPSQSYKTGIILVAMQCY